MSYNEFMNKVRYWDNQIAKWLMRHFYFIFFQAVLVGVFFIWFVNTIGVIDANLQAAKSDLTERILSLQSVNISILVLLILLNSFWMLFIFNSIQGLRVLLKDISFHISKLRNIKN